MQKLLATLALLVISIPAIADNKFSLGTGFDYSTGTYGNAASTSILMVPVIAKLESDGLTVKLTVPFISITGPGGVVQGVGRVGAAPVAVGGRNSTTTNSGLGDVTTSLGYTVYSADAFSLDLVGKVKFGTAAAPALGTGKTDYSVQVDGFYTLNQTTPFVTIGYKVYGQPVGYTLKNSPYATLGASQKLGEKTSAGIMLDFVKSPIATSADRRELTVFAAQKIGSSLKVQANLLKGFSNASPDFGGGIMITATF